MVDRYKALYETHGLHIPDDPHEQLRAGISAVFRSWNTPRAVKYREINKVTGLRGTAVNVQAMVYGNFNDNSGTGVCFTRNPATGEHRLFGEFLVNAQGEDVVAGPCPPTSPPAPAAHCTTQVAAPTVRTMIHTSVFKLSYIYRFTPPYATYRHAPATAFYVCYPQPGTARSQFFASSIVSTCTPEFIRPWFRNPCGT